MIAAPKKPSPKSAAVIPNRPTPVRSPSAASAPSNPSDPATFLLQHFERLAEAPGGIAKLRAVIVQLAMQGKLVAQTQVDEPGSVLLERIRAEKKRLINKGSISKEKPLPEIEADETPFDIPVTWAWSRLGDALEYSAGDNASPEELLSTGWLLELEDIEKNTSCLINEAVVSDRGPTSHKTKFQAGDVLYGKLRPYLNKVIVAHRGGYCTTEIIAMRPLCDVDSHFIKWALKRPDFLAYVARVGYGTKMPRLGTDDGRAAFLPLPPLAEQRRIVAKVEELMGLCDRLEAAQQQREEVRTRLRTSALHQLASPDSDSNSAAFVLQHLPSFTLETDDLGHLRRSVLELAVTGKLTQQIESDETAQKLIERMAKARKALAKPPKISALPEKLPLELPSTWAWQPLSALLSEPSQNGYSQSADESPDGVPLLRISAGTSRCDGDVEETDFKRTTLDAVTREKFALEVGDLLAVRFNGNLRFTGKVTIYRGKLRMLQIFPDKLIRLRIWNEFVVTEYVRLAMSAPAIRAVIESFCATSVGNMGISATDLVTVPIPLPPLAEQRRIVAKVDELMAVLDGLEVALTTTRATSEKLLGATIARLNEPVTNESPALLAAETSAPYGP